MEIRANVSVIVMISYILIKCILPPIHCFRPQYSWEKTLSAMFKKQRYIEYGVIVDQSVMKKYSNNRTLILLDVLDTVANANAILYNPFKINLILVDILFWESDEINVTQKYSKTYDQFERWVYKTYPWRGYDIVHLYTVIGLNDKSHNTEGIAANFPLDQAEVACGVIKFRTKNKKILAITVAHEIGHSLNISHDSFPDCERTNCIMASSIRLRHSKCWSVCSQISMLKYFSAWQSSCLTNIPDYSINFCGNDIVEYAEDCECGIHCSDKCCDGKTCKYKNKHASCWFGITRTTCSGKSAKCPRPHFAKL